MSRWFAATVLSIMLSCFGFAVFAQGLAGAAHTRDGAQSCVTNMALSDTSDVFDVTDASKAQAGDATELADELPSADEAGAEHAELLDARHPAPAPLLLSQQPRALALTPALSPLLDRPKRPPRGTAFAA